MIDDSKLEAAGQKAADALVALWQLDIFDPPIGSSYPRAKFCLDEISKIIAANGWSWALPYRGDGPPQWCGMTMGYVWAKAGLDPSWLATYFASTYRLKLWATYQNFDPKGKRNPALSRIEYGLGHRLYVDVRGGFGSVVPRAGDILIVGDGNPDCGDHVTGVISFDGSTGTFDTISGNGGGAGPRGDRRQGVSRRSYRIGAPGYAPMFLIRPAQRDLL